MKARSAPTAAVSRNGHAITPAVSSLFFDLTGLRLRYLQAPARGLGWDTTQTARVCCDRKNGLHGAPLAPACERCLRENVRRSLAATRRGHQFRADCGALMFLLPVDGQGRPLGVLALRSPPAPRAREPSPAGPVPVEADLRFRRAVMLLRLLASDAAVRDRAAAIASDLGDARDALTAREHELRQLRTILGRLAPGLQGSEVSAASREVRAADPAVVHPMVQRVLDLIHGEPARPQSLKGIADALDVNPSYLSFLFSRELGLPFRSYVAALRLQRARDLLLGPRTSIAEAAKAVGYASADRFRAAFRQWSGLGPGKWRRVFRKT